MIYTVTLNPSLDYIIKLEHLLIDSINRPKDVKIRSGGKGINVSVMLKRLGYENIATGFVAGFCGDELVKMTEAEGVKTNFVKLESGNTRINVKLLSDKTVYCEPESGKGENKLSLYNEEAVIPRSAETQINAQGPEITDGDIERLKEKLLPTKEGDIIIFSGSAPAGCGKDIYERIITPLQGRGVRFAFDVPGAYLKDLCKYHPLVLKPNVSELADAFVDEFVFPNYQSVGGHAYEMTAAGAENILVSMGEGGAILASGGKGWISREAPKGEAVYTIGAGDSMLAGFIAEYLRSGDLKECLKFSVACGSATAYSEGLADLETVEKLYNQMDSD